MKIFFLFFKKANRAGECVGESYVGGSATAEWNGGTSE